MLWLFLSLIAAFSVACREVSVKALADLAPAEVAMLELFCALPLLGVGCLQVEVPPLDATFWWASLVSLPLNMVAVKRSSIVFSVILSWIFLHEEQAVIRGLGTLFMFAGVLLITF